MIFHNHPGSTKAPVSLPSAPLRRSPAPPAAAAAPPRRPCRAAAAARGAAAAQRSLALEPLIYWKIHGKMHGTWESLRENPWKMRIYQWNLNHGDQAIIG